jgi:hypothetical protein
VAQQWLENNANERPYYFVAAKKGGRHHRRQGTTRFRNVRTDRRTNERTTGPVDWFWGVCRLEKTTTPTFFDDEHPQQK